jgi:tRNA-2-methylthio-N6-dimethylallyladenosine synthase
LTNKEKSRFLVKTFGCQMNVNDSERIAGLLTAEGMEATSDAATADFVFINTCAVREKAASKLDHSLHRLRHLRKGNPDLRIGVGGCVAQLEGRAILERAPFVDVLVGTHNVHRVPDLLRDSRPGQPGVDLDRRADTFAVPDDKVAHSSRVRAYVTAIEGCNHVCSFCVVPRTRGPEVNRSPEKIVAEVESLVERGYPEVMLLGQTVNAYRHGDVDFAGLLERVSAVRGLRRLRFTTSHPEHVSERMAEALRLPGVCPYLHLPVQSGSDRILSEMRRGYTRGEYLEKVALLRARIPGLALTSDVIVGYPGESDEDFEATASLVEEVGFEGLFVFAYSSRPGTTAARVDDDIPAEEKSRRLQYLNQAQQDRQRLHNRALVGTRQEVLVDTIEGPGLVSGRSPHFRIVHVPGPPALMGNTVLAEVVESGPNALKGRLLQAVH